MFLSPFVSYVYGGRYAGPYEALRQQYLRVLHNPNRLVSMTAAEARAAPPVPSVSDHPTVAAVTAEAPSEHAVRPTKFDYSGGAWQKTEPSGAMASGMTAPNNAASLNLAIATKNSFEVVGLEASFEFKWRSEYTTAGFVFGANSNASSFWIVDFPFTGGGPYDQKTEMFWVTLSKVRTKEGWRETVESQLMTGVSSNPEVLHKVCVKVLRTGRGTKVLVQVDERGQAELHVPEEHAVSDAGFIGFATHNNLGVGNKCTFSELIVHSPPLAAPIWAGHAAVNRVPFGVIEDAPSAGGVGNIVHLRDELLMTNTVSNLRTNKSTQPGIYVLRSKSHGQTWTVSDKPLPSTFSGHCPACSADDHGLSLVASADAKTVSAFFVIDVARSRNGTTTCTVGRASSPDGVSWSAPTVVWRGTFDERLPFISVTLNAVVPLRDGSLVMFLTGATNVSYKKQDFGEGLKVRCCLCLVFPLPSWLRRCLCLVFLLPSWPL